MRKAREYRTTSREVYKAFKLKHPELKLSYVEWCNIIYTFNYGFRDYCLETGEKAKFPYGFGDFCVTKFKPKKTAILPNGDEIINLPVNWKKTMELGKKIYHMNFNTEGFKFRWLWSIGSCRFYKHDIWSFKPSRVSSRLIKHYLDNNYQHKYLKWK